MDNLENARRVAVTVCKMLRKRGYLVPDNPFVDAQSASDFELSVYKENDPSDRVVVKLPTEKVSSKMVNELNKMLSEEEIKRCIIVYSADKSPTTFAKLGAGLGIKFEFFKMNELLVDITEHVLVPEHELLTPDEKQTLLNRYKLKEGQLPRMKLTDPISRYYGLERSDVMKITRMSETAGRYVTYRLAI
eukprot:TRINITY_DN775807_c0_g1_i1.p1 TRINITY_DN775807_c0_g1~~TRINITY_DN775807_c0_g1_i1.p1  ORF type:complete len:190 (-),score=45.95 TRINITY_DN775807_c0_g1_i1:304-873(-)